jgi:FkbM family methyltransferase
MIIFDIGANKGEYTQYLLNTFRGSKVVSVEANDKLATALKSRFPNGTIVNKAVSNVVGEIDFHECTNSNGVSTVSEVFMEKSCFTSSEHIMADGKAFKDHYQYAPPIKIPTISIDELIAEHGDPDMIKIDIEGHELEALKSLSKKSGKITFEWHETFKDRIIECARHLSSLGYTKFGTEIWYSGKDYHNRELAEGKYLDLGGFIEWFNTTIDNTTEKDRRPNCIERSGMMWVK